MQGGVRMLRWRCTDGRVRLRSGHRIHRDNASVVRKHVCVLRALRSGQRVHWCECAAHPLRVCERIFEPGRDRFCMRGTRTVLYSLPSGVLLWRQRRTGDALQRNQRAWCVR
jgi:hypothetical protein